MSRDTAPVVESVSLSGFKAHGSHFLYGNARHDTPLCASVSYEGVSELGEDVYEK